MRNIRYSSFLHLYFYFHLHTSGPLCSQTCVSESERVSARTDMAIAAAQVIAEYRFAAMLAYYLHNLDPFIFHCDGNVRAALVRDGLRPGLRLRLRAAARGLRNAATPISQRRRSATSSPGPRSSA